MYIEGPKIPSAEEMAKMQKERVLNDAELIKDGAEYAVQDDGNLRLEATPGQIESARKEMESFFNDIENKKISEDEHVYFQGYSKIFDMANEINYLRNKGALDPESYRGLMEKVSSLNKDGHTQYQEKIGDDSMRKMEKMTREKFFQQIAERFSQASDFEEIIDAVDRLAGIQGSKQYYNNKTLKEILTKVKNGNLGIDHVTNTYGLRDALTQVLEKQKDKGEQSPDNKETFEDLFKFITEKGEVISQSGSYRANELIEIIKRVRSGELGLNYVTRAEGLREKVGKLLELEKKSGGEISAEQEMEPDAQKDLADFASFASKRENELSKLNNDEEIENYIYNNFYSNGEEKEYKSGEQKTEEARKSYNSEVINLRNEISREMDTYLKRGENPPISIAKMGYWTSCSTGEGLKNAKNIGRLYLNIKPGEVAKFFKEAVKFFSNMNLNIQMKIPSEFYQEESEEILNRRDKMVIYFGQGSEEKILDVLDHLHGKYKNAFIGGNPRFSAELKGAQGNPMEGVGFAEEPEFTRRRNESFGSIRSAILCEVIKMVKAEGKTMENFDFKNAFKMICGKHKVDSLHPAFNSASKRLEQKSPIFQRL